MSLSKRRVLLTHYDLDGVGCDILLSKIWNFEKRHCCGYGKIRKKIDNGDLMWYDSCVVSDVSLTEKQYNKISEEYKDKFLYIDHHQPSIDMVEKLVDNSSLCVVNNKFSATALILQTFHKKLLDTSPTTIKFISAIDGYDMWRHKTHPEIFDRGYDLNILFWKYGYFDMFDRFSENMSMIFSPVEQRWIDEHKKKRDFALNNSEMTEFGNNSLCVINVPSAYVNDYTLQYPEYDFYYMICVDRDNNLVLSVRSTVDDKWVSIGHVLRGIRDSYDIVLSAGGHRQAGGVDFDNKTPLNSIIDIIEDINNQLEAINNIPF
jgi:oligoribonuclease NrnB/cAMP/cGMP phosphodiesterase (DHH superfamily)